MSVTGFLIKSVKVAACLVVMLMFLAGSMLCLKERELKGASIIATINFAGAVVAGLAMIRSIRSKAVPDFPSDQELEDAGLVVTENCEATRAVQIKEVEDEGSHYLVELADGSILCLSGKYLYEYEEGRNEDDQPIRRFPNTRFQLKRHVPSDEIWDISCTGDAFEPTHTFEGYLTWEFDADRVPLDGQIFSEASFDEFVANNGRLPKKALAD